MVKLHGIDMDWFGPRSYIPSHENPNKSWAYRSVEFCWAVEHLVIIIPQEHPRTIFFWLWPWHMWRWFVDYRLTSPCVVQRCFLRFLNLTTYNNGDDWGMLQIALFYPEKKGLFLYRWVCLNMTKWIETSCSPQLWPHGYYSYNWFFLWDYTVP